MHLFLLNVSALSNLNAERILTPTSVDSEPFFIIRIGRIWRIPSFDKKHMNVETAVVLHILFIKHHKVCYNSCVSVFTAL